MKKRFLFNQLFKYLNHKNAIVITGMRQVGKTTLMKQLFENVEAPKLWFDLDNPLDQLIFENDNYDAIYNLLNNQAKNSNKRLFVFIDEIQNLPEITIIMKYLIDKYNVKFVVSGSSNYYLKNLFPESLSGRKFLFVLPTLSFKEYLFFKYDEQILHDEMNIDKVLAYTNENYFYYKKYELDFKEFMEYGGFPEVVITKDFETKKLVLKNIFASFFEKDIKLLTDLKDVRELRDLILLLAPRAGNMLDITKISSELGINRVKLYSYLEFLQGVFLISLVPKFSSNIDRSVAGGKKIYFNDNGLLNIIGKLNEGQIFENQVFNQLNRYGELSFYNKRNIAEIDFILNKEYAFEVKLRGTEIDLRKLRNNCEKIGLKKYFLISLNESKNVDVLYPVLL